MFACLFLITWTADASPDDQTEIQNRLLALSNGTGSLLAGDLPPNRNGGNLLWRTAFPSRALHDTHVAQQDWHDIQALMDSSGAIARIDRIAYESLRSADQRPGLPGGLYRVLALAIEPGTPSAKIEAFEAEMMAMPSYVTSILRWNFGRVVACQGARPFTHIWEQEFASLTHFRGDYMDHPYHWGHLDRWFDSDNPAQIVDAHLCNSFCSIDRPVLFETVRLETG